MFWLLSAIFTKFPFLMLKVSPAASFPAPLTPEEEKECFLKMKDGDCEARERLINCNMRLVAHIVKKYYTNHRDQEDLISIGTIGLIKAIDSYNVENGTKFATYAGKCLQNEILMHFRAQKKTACESSINDTIELDRDGNPLTYIDIISVDDNIIDEIDLKSKRDMIMWALQHKLTPRERKIITLRYGLNDSIPITQREAAEKLGISRSYVSRIEKSALEKIKAYLMIPKNYI